MVEFIQILHLKYNGKIVMVNYIWEMDIMVYMQNLERSVTIHTYNVGDGICLRQDTGRVGIGTRNPGYKLEVQVVILLMD